MKLLVLGFFYPPDLSAGSFRIHALINALKIYGLQGLEVDLITTQPNRYSELSAAVEASEDHGWLRIKRIDLPTQNGGMMDQAKAFLTYAKAVRALTKDGDWNLVFATSGRLMTAALGAYVSRRLRVPLYLDMRDILTDVMRDLLKGSALRLLLPFFRWLEGQTFRTAIRINVVSAGFLEHFRQIVPHQKCSVFTNGIDSDFLTTNFCKDTTSDGLPIILYAGNIGEGQGLHRIIPGAALALAGQADFRIIGSGRRLVKLKSALAHSKVKNVELQQAVPRTSLLIQYSAADILFLHLDDHPVFLKVLPSKIFEYAAVGKPIVAGVSGYAAEFLRKEVPNVQVFDPCDVHGMVKAVTQALSNTEPVDRSAFLKAFNRTTIMDNMAADIISTLRSNSWNR